MPKDNSQKKNAGEKDNGKSSSVSSSKKEYSSDHFKGKRIGELDFGSVIEVNLLGDTMEVFAGSLPPGPCQCSTYYT